MPQFESGVIQGNQARGWTDRPDLNDPKNWNEHMQKLWSNDQGYVTGETLQKTQIEQFRKVKAALDEFKPDALLLMFRDLGETWGNAADPANPRPKYWFHAQPTKEVQLYNLFGSRQNYHEEDPDQYDTIHFHTDATNFLFDKLKSEAPVAPELANAVKTPLRMGHNFVAGVVHTDWDKREFKTPFIAIGMDPFGYGRTRNNEGLSPWDKNAEPPLTPAQGFEVGRVLARAIKASPYRIALIADCDWSHANDHARSSYEIAPSTDHDRERFQEWSAGNFKNWGDSWTHDEMEQFGDWQMLPTIILAGAMTEVGANVKYAHFQEDNQIFNDSMVTTIFESK